MMKGKSTRWEKVFAKHTYDKSTLFYSEFCKVTEPIQCLCVCVCVCARAHVWCVCISICLSITYLSIIYLPI